jgi:glycosyltransferase involved in cell wall biosynthesis
VVVLPSAREAKEASIRASQLLLFLSACHRFQLWSGHLSPEDKVCLQAATLLLDGQAAAALRLLQPIPKDPGFTWSYNLGLALEMAGGGKAASYWLGRAEKLNPPLFRKLREPKTPPFRITFLLSYLGPTGAIKVLLHQAHYLKSQGHEVLALVPEKLISSLPWPVEFTLLTFDLNTSPFQLPPSDAVIVADWPVIPFTVGKGESSVLYYAQGEMATLRPETIPASIYNLKTQFLSLPILLLAVSPYLGEKLRSASSRPYRLLPPGIDDGFFSEEEKSVHFPPRFLFVGPDIPDKGPDLALETVALIRSRLPKAEFIWVTPWPVNRHFEGRQIVNPVPEKLARTYREADVLLHTSIAESFPLPPLEAMAAGTPVVAADSGGIRTYARHGKNSFICSERNPYLLARYALRLVEEPGLYSRLSREGRKTAAFHRWERSDHLLSRLLEESLSRPRPAWPCGSL